MRALVTGGAGFVGSHLVERLLAAGHAVVAFDNLSSGRLDFLAGYLGHPRLAFVRGDVLDLPALESAADGCDAVFHLAASSDVRAGLRDASLDLRRQAVGTWNVLEAMRRRGVTRIVLASSSAVYGVVEGGPVPEHHGPLAPVSLYGAAKVAAEAFVSAYCHLHGWRGWIFRLANVVGPRMTHGVIHDLVAKLRRDPRRLEVLGDGRQRKPYLHVTDCVDGMLFAFERAGGRVAVFNLAPDSTVDVATIVGIVIRALGLRPEAVAVRFAGGPGGWAGDVPRVALCTERMRALGWQPRWTAVEAVERAAREFVAELPSAGGA